MLSVAFAATVLVACGRQSTPANRAMNDDLKRDLAMAASAGLDLASEQKSASFPLTEVPISSAPAPSKVLKKASGPKATASKRPTVKAAPEPSVAQAEEQPEVQAVAEAPSPTTAPVPEVSNAPAVPRPSPVPVDASAGDGARGQGSGGSSAGDGGGSVLGGIFGVIIRGGVVDGDHCDPRTDGRNRGGGRRGTFPRDPGMSMPLPRIPIGGRTRM